MAKVSKYGQWKYPGEDTIIPSGDITMQGVPYPVLGIDNLGNTKMMQPGGDYTFPGTAVYEIPMMAYGGNTSMPNLKRVKIKTLPKAQTTGQFNSSYDVNLSPAENIELNRRAQVAGWNSVDEYRNANWAYNTAAQNKNNLERGKEIANWMDANYKQPSKEVLEQEKKERFAKHLTTPSQEDLESVNPETGYAKAAYTSRFGTGPKIGGMSLWSPEDIANSEINDADITDYLNASYNKQKITDEVGQLTFDIAFSKDEKEKKKLNSKLKDKKYILDQADKAINSTEFSRKFSAYQQHKQDSQQKANMLGTTNTTVGPLDAAVGLYAAAPAIASTLGLELLGTGVTLGNVVNPAFHAVGTYNFLNPDSDFRQAVSRYNAGEGDWRDVAFEGGLNALNFLGAKNLSSDLNAVKNIGAIGSTGRRFKDLQNLQHWAKQYGYNIPDIQRVAKSDMLTDMTFRGLLNRHNTFVRGVSTNWPKVKETLSGRWLGEENAWSKLIKELEAQGINYETNPQAAAEYMASHIPGETGYGRYGLKKGEHALYVSNSKPNAEGYTYGDGYSVTLRRPTDFSSSNRLDWISANEYPINYGFRGSPYGTGIVANDYQKRLPTSIRDFVYVTKDPMKQHRLTQGLDDVYRKAQTDAWPMQRKFRNKKDALAKATNPKNRRGVLAADYDKSRSMSWTPGEDDLVFKDSPNLLDYAKMSYYDFMRAYYDIKPELAPLKVVLKEMFLDPKVYRGFAQNAFGELDPFSHYAFKGQPGEKIFDVIRTDRVTPEIWQNTSRAHMGTGSARYTRKQEGGDISIPSLKQIKIKSLPKAQLIGDIKTGIGKIADYEYARGRRDGTGLTDYGNPLLGTNPKRDDAINWMMTNVLPIAQPYYTTPAEQTEAVDFIYNTGRDPRIYQLDQYLKSIGQSGLPNRGSFNIDYYGAKADKKAVAAKLAELDKLWQQYAPAINKLSVNDRRQLLNKGRDFYYQNIDLKPDGTPSDAYYNTWYGRIWNTNDAAPFDPNDKRFKKVKQAGGSTEEEILANRNRAFQDIIVDDEMFDEGDFELYLDQAQTGGELPDDYQDFLNYSETAPENRRPDSEWQYGNPRQYDHYGMWDALGKPKTFEEALAKNPHWQPDPYDGMYHGFSTNPDTGVWLKSHIPGESHPGDTGWMEYKDFMLSNDRNWGGKNQNLVFDPELQRMRYIERKQDGGGIINMMQQYGYKPAPETPDVFDQMQKMGILPQPTPTLLDQYNQVMNAFDKPKPVRFKIPEDYYTRLMQQENGVNKGLKDGRYYQYTSEEGGNDTIGYGHKLTDDDVKTNRYSKGLTKDEAIALMRNDAEEHLDRTLEQYETKFGKGSFDKLHPDLKVLALDFVYNGLPIEEYPNFFGAANQYSTTKDATVKKQAYEKMLKNYIRNVKKDGVLVPLGERNKYTRSVLDNLK